MIGSRPTGRLFRVVGAVLEERPFGPGGWPIPFDLDSAGST